MNDTLNKIDEHEKTATFSLPQELVDGSPPHADRKKSPSAKKIRLLEQPVSEQLQTLSIKIDMFALKFDLVGATSLAKLEALDDYIRNTTSNIQKQVSAKEEELKLRFVSREAVLTQQVEALKSKVGQLELLLGERKKGGKVQAGDGRN
jgi:hypothetical protein